MNEQETTENIEAIIQAVTAKLSYPLDTRGYGGEYGGLLLSGTIKESITRELRRSLIAEGKAQKAPPGAFEPHGPTMNDPKY